MLKIDDLIIDKETGNAEMMKHLNDLKAVWGI